MLQTEQPPFLETSEALLEPTTSSKKIPIDTKIIQLKNLIIQGISHPDTDSRSRKISRSIRLAADDLFLKAIVRQTYARELRDLIADSAAQDALNAVARALTKSRQYHLLNTDAIDASHIANLMPVLWQAEGRAASRGEPSLTAALGRCIAANPELHEAFAEACAKLSWQAYRMYKGELGHKHAEYLKSLPEQLGLSGHSLPVHEALSKDQQAPTPRSRRDGRVTAQPPAKLFQLELFS